MEDDKEALGMESKHTSSYSLRGCGQRMGRGHYSTEDESENQPQSEVQLYLLTLRS